MPPSTKIVINPIAYRTLNSKNWIESDIINGYLKLLYLNLPNAKEREKICLIPDLYFTYYIDTGNFKGNVDYDMFLENVLNKYRYIYIPGAIDRHWVLFIVHAGENRNIIKINIMESKNYYMRNKNVYDKEANKIKTFLEFLGYDTSNTKIEYKQSPHQYNGWDCGVFLMENARKLILGIDDNIKQADMDKFRQRIKYELKKQEIVYEPTINRRQFEELRTTLDNGTTLKSNKKHNKNENLSKNKTRKKMNGEVGYIAEEGPVEEINGPDPFMQSLSEYESQKSGITSQSQRSGKSSQKKKRAKSSQSQRSGKSSQKKKRAKSSQSKRKSGKSSPKSSQSSQKLLSSQPKESAKAKDIKCLVLFCNLKFAKYPGSDVQIVDKNIAPFVVKKNKFDIEDPQAFYNYYTVRHQLRKFARVAKDKILKSVRGFVSLSVYVKDRKTPILQTWELKNGTAVSIQIPQKNIGTILNNLFYENAPTQHRITIPKKETTKRAQVLAYKLWIGSKERNVDLPKKLFNCKYDDLKRELEPWAKYGPEKGDKTIHAKLGGFILIRVFSDDQATKSSFQVLAFLARRNKSGKRLLRSLRFITLTRSIFVNNIVSRRAIRQTKDDVKDSRRQATREDNNILYEVAAAQGKKRAKNGKAIPRKFKWLTDEEVAEREAKRKEAAAAAAAAAEKPQTKWQKAAATRKAKANRKAEGQRKRQETLAKKKKQ